MSTPRHLRAVTEHGEVIEDPAREIVRLGDIISGLRQQNDSLSHQLNEALRDRDAQAEAHKAWPAIVKLWELWAQLTGSEAMQWDNEIFWSILPFYRTYGPELCEAAIRGKVHDHFKSENENGLVTHYWEITRIFAPRRKPHGSPVFGPDVFLQCVKKAPRPVLLALIEAGTFEKLKVKTRRFLAEVMADEFKKRSRLGEQRQLDV